MKLVFLNTHSVLNPGDVGIVQAQAQFFKNYSPDAKITLTSRTPELDKRYYESIKARVLPPLIPAPSVFENVHQKIVRSLRNLLDLRSKASLIKEIKECDLVVCSGGGYFYSSRRIFPGPMFLQNILHVELAHLFRKPIVFFPQSFGPICNLPSKSLLKHILYRNKTIKIFCREEISFDFLSQLSNKNKNISRVETCPDMAFFLSGENLQPVESPQMDLPRPVMALTLRSWDFPEIKSRKDKIAKQIDYLNILEEVSYTFFKKWGGSVIVFPLVTGPGTFEDDRIISKQFWGRLKQRLPQRNALFLARTDVMSPQEIMDIFSRLDLVVATRFHSALFALISGIPVVSIAYQPKSKGIMRMLKLDRFCVDINTMNSTEILEKVEEILLNPSDKRREIKDKIGSMKASMERKLGKTIPLDFMDCDKNESSPS